MCSSYYIINHIDSILLFPVIWQMLQHRCQDTWNLFKILNTMIQLASRWNSMKNLLIIPKDIKRNITFTSHQDLLNKIVGIDVTSRTQITGKSGAGKTTLMKSYICELYNISPKCLNYMGQKSILPKMNLKVFLGKTDRDIFKLAKILNIDNIVNPQTINKNIGNISEGEEKRLFLLQTLLKVSNKKPFLFVDEVTSNLDIQNHTIVEKIFDDLEKEGIIIIEISHHEVPNTFKIGVKNNVAIHV